MRFSIISLVNNPRQYAELTADLAAQQFAKPVERIEIPNVEQQHTCLATPVNQALGTARGEFAIVCHQDLRVPANWLARIDRFLEQLEGQDEKVGIVGMAGAGKTRSRSWGAVYLFNMYDGTPDASLSEADYYRAQHGDYCEVQCLDELCLIFRPARGFRFDDRTCDHFHWYGADLCLEAISRGFRNYAIDAPCLHISDGISNLIPPAAAAQFRAGSLKLFKKWSRTFPYWRTTTADFNSRENEIFFWVSKYLKLRYGVTFPEYIQGL